MNTTHDFILWIATFAYAFHILEEYTFDWKTWAIKVLHFDVDWTQFYLTNAVVIVGGFCVAMVGWRLPELSLAFPALMLVNAVLFHVVPVIRTRQFSPGLFTAVILFFPIGLVSYTLAAQDGVLTPQALLISLILGGIFMAYPILLLRYKPRFASYH